MKKKYSFDINPKDEELFKDVKFLVEATYHEQFVLWQDYFNKPKYGRKAKSWKQVYTGHGLQIGTINKRPICVQIFYAILNGKKVMFYEGCSELVDHKMIKDWIQYWTLDNIKWDVDRWAHCDAQNFHLCLDGIEDD